MTIENEQPDDCVSRKPWSEVLNRSLKMFTFNMAKEGGRSVGKVVFFIILGLLALFLTTYLIDMATGWFSNMFDFWPFTRDASVAATEEVKWYCKWNPVC